MSQNRPNVQEMAVHLSQQLSHAFGAAYCRITLFSGRLEPADEIISHTNGKAREVVAIVLSRFEGARHAQNLNGGPAGAREHNLAEPFTPDVEALSRLTSACRKAKPALRFCWQADGALGNSGIESGCLDVMFNTPRQFSVVEMTSLLMMAEAARMMLIFTRMAAAHASDAEQVARKLQGDLFTMPFLEAKKQWIDAFEHEYLRQQMAKYFGNISKAARAARISRYTLYALLNKFQFSAQSFKRTKPVKSSLSRGGVQNGRKKTVAEKDAIQNVFEQLS